MSGEMVYFVVISVVGLIVLGITVLPYKRKSEKEDYDDPSGNDNIRRKFWDYM